ncbi:hypothetical protein EHW61_15830 [Salinivibrio sp. VYel6]|uniref:hypothetical protein n=1 Tax=Salinivibrio sp. VYel6 TaxID=2490493 RepID=UPI00128C1FFA|nr:hypothetical protein [Salinivibrio sp. VYel6]MPX98104.1 hypothetical protein [Salinivibrio sp. VYel6]
MSNTPIVIAVLALVLVGMLFGLNFQVSESAVTFFNAMGTTLSGVGAAAAAYISYLSIGQWREQSKHSLLLDNINKIDKTLDCFHDEIIHELATSKNDSFIIDTALSVSIKKEIRGYISAYREIMELCNDELQMKIKKIEINHIKAELFEIFDSHDKKIKQRENRIKGINQKPTEKQNKEIEMAMVLFEKQRKAERTEFLFFKYKKIISEIRTEIC